VREPDQLTTRLELVIKRMDFLLVLQGLIAKPAPTSGGNGKELADELSSPTSRTSDLLYGHELCGQKSCKKGQKRKGESISWLGCTRRGGVERIRKGSKRVELPTE